MMMLLMPVDVSRVKNQLDKRTSELLGHHDHDHSNNSLSVFGNPDGFNHTNIMVPLRG
jgi:hypothetical protein